MSVPNYFFNYLKETHLISFNNYHEHTLAMALVSISKYLLYCNAQNRIQKDKLFLRQSKHLKALGFLVLISEETAHLEVQLWFGLKGKTASNCLSNLFTFRIRPFHVLIFDRQESVSPGVVGNYSARAISRSSVSDASPRKYWQSEMQNPLMWARESSLVLPKSGLNLQAWQSDNQEFTVLLRK